MNLSLESLGMTQEEAAERVVKNIVDRLMEDDGGGETAFQESLKGMVVERINEAVKDIAGKNVLPNVAAYVENTCLQETNKWGEKLGVPLTFTEYLVKRANSYLIEEVDFRGKTKAEDNSYSWKQSGTRVAWLVHEHLQYSIKSAMESALKSANESIVGGLERAVKIGLEEVSAKLKVKVTA